MINRFLKNRLPNGIAKKATSIITTPAQARVFCSGFVSCPEAMQCNSIEDLVQNPYLWIPSQNVTEQQNWVKEVYPKNIEYDTVKIQSVLKCSKCGNNQVEYYEKQVRGADEPMTVFAHCTVSECGKRWVQ
jgi:DNA-directed RNA polymerase subunit M/transcription elongation factor TFIIS|tara:strand:- start:43 stop:435 length:393 start_codon:yes stop_codon:yes gene_type:complete